jgi:hypothetical protein
MVSASSVAGTIENSGPKLGMKLKSPAMTPRHERERHTEQPQPIAVAVAITSS